MKEEFRTLTFSEKEALIIALLYLSEISGKDYSYEVKETENLYSVFVEIESRAEVEYLNRLYGASLQYYTGYYSHHFQKFSINKK